MSLVAKNLEKSYGQRKVVKGVSLEVAPGEIVGLLGPNGAGKTTTFYMIVGMVRAEEGQVLMDGKNITDLAMFKRARSGLGYLSQEPSPCPARSLKKSCLCPYFENANRR